jgi:hypothetical protein
VEEGSPGRLVLEEEHPEIAVAMNARIVMTIVGYLIMFSIKLIFGLFVWKPFRSLFVRFRHSEQDAVDRLP